MKIQFCPRDDAANLYPPIPAKKCMPEWYKQSGVAVPGHKHKITAADMMHDPSVQLSTIKKCPPATDFMTSGYIIRNFLDIMMTQKWDEDAKKEIRWVLGKMLEALDKSVIDADNLSEES